MAEQANALESSDTRRLFVEKIRPRCHLPVSIAGALGAAKYIAPAIVIMPTGARLPVGQVEFSRTNSRALAGVVHFKAALGRSSPPARAQSETLLSRDLRAPCICRDNFGLLAQMWSGFRFTSGTLLAWAKIVSPIEKVVIFRFCGGPRDGQSVRSDRPQQGVNEAHTFWALSRKGMIGRRFDVQAPTDLVYHRYKVISKWEDAGEIHVTCSHVG